VVEGQWFYDTVQKASANGYITGYEDNTIRPNNPITREEVATIIARIMNLKLNDEGIEDFIDKDKINWSSGYVGAVVIKEYMVGFPDGFFKPQKNITRGEAVYALNNIVCIKEIHDVEAIVKQDFLGITYIHVISNSEGKPSEVKANGQNLTYDKKDGKWKGTTLDLEIGDTVKISIIKDGEEETLTVKVKDMTDS
ncbi:S-layer homology domain-containing protein, partial [Schnuerera sp.]|uniref:S-layer homology domain-containing protein n=1 Tax=Schnuerera sp. TaxID=2794844 RepID=UPI002C6F0E0C